MEERQCRGIGTVELMVCGMKMKLSALKKTNYSINRVMGMDVMGQLKGVTVNEARVMRECNVV